MEVSELTLKLILLLTPGAVASIIFEKLTVHKSSSSFRFVLNSILFGGISYLLAQIFTSIFLRNTTLYHFWEKIATKEIPFDAINSALIASVFVGFTCSALDHYKVLNRIGKALRITNKYGDESLFYFFLNARNVVEVYLRDLDHGLTYHGLIVSYSQTEEVKEVVLRDVRVYQNSNGVELYRLDKIYLSLPKDRIIIEVPLVETNQRENGEDGEEVDPANGGPDKGQSKAE